MVNSTTLEPQDMNWLEKGVLGITWTDGHHGVYPVRVLRQHCPCAACTDEWTGEVRLDPEDIPLFIRLEDVAEVGRYALQFTWSDGHNSGIYSFTLLRKICHCLQCRPAQPVQPKNKRLL